MEKPKDGAQEAQGPFPMISVKMLEVRAEEVVLLRSCSDRAAVGLPEHLEDAWGSLVLYPATLRRTMLC